MYYSVKYPAEELEMLMEKYPLDKDETDCIFNQVIGFEFTEEIAVPALLLIKRNGYFIKIRKSDSEKEKKKSAIHEILHIDYKADGRAEGTESLLDKETERIYTKHPRLTDYIFERVKGLSS